MSGLVDRQASEDTLRTDRASQITGFQASEDTLKTDSASQITGFQASEDTLRTDSASQITGFQARSRGGRCSWTLKLAQKRSSVGRWS